MFLCNYKRGRTGFCASRNSVFLFRGKYLFMAFAHFLSGSCPRWETRPRSYDVSSVAWQATGRAGPRVPHVLWSDPGPDPPSRTLGRTQYLRASVVPSVHGSNSSYFTGVTWRTENKAWRPAREQWHLWLLLTDVTRTDPGCRCW